MSLTDKLESSLKAKETSNTTAWATILIGGVVLSGSVGAFPVLDNFPKIDTRSAYEINEIATSSSGSFAKIEFGEKPEVDFLPDMPMKQVVKAKIVRERTMSFSSELFD